MNVLLNKREAAARIGVNPHTLVRMAKGGRFPAPVRLGDHPLAEHRFIESEVEAWIEARVVERDALAAEPPRPQKPGRGRPKGSKNKPTLKKLKADLRRVMMKHRLSMPDLRLVMRAFGIEKLRDLPTERHPEFTATLIALGERYVALAAE